MYAATQKIENQMFPKSLETSKPMALSMLAKNRLRLPEFWGD
jgi:hypothetical protein